MRPPLALLLPLLALAGCGSGAGDNGQPGSERWARNLIGNEGSRHFERPDGSFDRADYRRVMVPGCAAGMRDGGPTIPAGAIDRYCACFVDRLLATNSDDELRAMRPGGAVEEREFEEASRSCRPTLPGGAGDEPPPEEPVPSMNDPAPPPVAGGAPPAPPTGIPTAAPDMAIVRNRAGRPLDCVAPGRTYDPVPAGGGVAVRDVTPAGR